MKYLKQIAGAIILGVVSVAAPSVWAQSGAHTMVTPGELKWVDVPSLPPGAKLAAIEGPLNEPVPFTFRLRFPADYKIPAHWHPAIEHVTVISGTINMGVGDKTRSGKNQIVASRKRRHHATQNEPFSLDERRNDCSDTWSRTLGDHLRQPCGRSQEEMN
jgi:hypothetical protein